MERGTRSPQASLGPPSSRCKGARAGGVSDRPSAVPPGGAAAPARGPFHAVCVAAARGRAPMTHPAA